MCDLCVPTPDSATSTTLPAHRSAPPMPSRRRFLQTAAMAAAAQWTLSSAFAALPAAAAPNAISPAEALERLMKGNVRYAANSPKEKDFSLLRAALVTAQYPIVALLSCADSRLAPEFAFDQAPGDLFVTRVAGNYASPTVLSSLEYAVAVLNVPLVMVLGHTNCGAISATIKAIEDKEMLPGTLQDIANAISPAVNRARGVKGSGSLTERSVVENVKWQMEVLTTRPSLLMSMTKAKKVQVVGGVYDLATGEVTLV